MASSKDTTKLLFLAKVALGNYRLEGQPPVHTAPVDQGNSEKEGSEDQEEGSDDDYQENSVRRSHGRHTGLSLHASRSKPQQNPGSAELQIQILMLRSTPSLIRMQKGVLLTIRRPRVPQ